MLADDSWKSETVLFSVQDLIDEVVPSVLPLPSSVKVCNCVINNHLKATRYAPRQIAMPLRRIFAATDATAVTSTQVGKSPSEVDQDESSEDRLTFRILDTGEGVKYS